MTSTPTQKRLSLFLQDLIPAVVALLLFGAGLGVGWLIWAPHGAPAQQAAAPSAPAGLAGDTRFDVQADDDPALGPADAPITIIEFSDFQCPYCQRWHAQVFDQLMQAYPGKIRFIYRDFPLKSIHPQAVPAAEAANCAQAQGAYWEFHAALFSGKYNLSAPSYLQYAADLGLNTQEFQKCVDSHQFAAEVESDFAYAMQLGVSSTPTFFINGIPLIGAQPVEAFQQVIDQELAGR